ncbi:MAG: ADP-ribosylglycohydrolase family protein [Anaerolineales bacterium]|nr:ADP-ribosylglycohydrolase family protein [Anaerolineales bacterium]
MTVTQTEQGDLMNRYDRTYGALLGLALGDALGFPALFHRAFQFPEKRREFIWRTNRDLARERVLRLTLPFTHRLPPALLEPFPTDDTEYTVLSAQILLDTGGAREPAAFAAAWRARVLPRLGEALTGFAERAALENLRSGLEPPATGNDNPQHYSDSAAVRAVASGLYAAGDPERAAALAAADAALTAAEDGLFAARAMAAAVALLAAGAPLAEAAAAARAEFPAGSWIARGDALARACAAEAAAPPDLALTLGTRLINTVYSYGDAAPETVPAALVIAEAAQGQLWPAVLLANALPKSADSLPALVGALCGACSGPAAVGAGWRALLNECRGLCLPDVAGARLDALAARLAAVGDRP